jgi:hypothetical protein
MDVRHIVRLRNEYYARRGAPVQERWDGDWSVAEVDGRVVAVQSYQQKTDKERWIMDTYVEESRDGVRGFKALGDAAHEAADRDGVWLFGITELDNNRQQHAAIGHGWSPAGVLLVRPPKGTAPCPP